MNTFNLFENISLTGEDKSRNILVTGVPGVGVTKYFLSLIKQDMGQSNPVVLFDQYGDICDEIISGSNDETLEKIAYIDVGNTEYPVGINIFENNGEYQRQETCSMLINLMYDLYDPNRSGIIGPRFEHAVKNAILTIMYGDKASFIELLRCLTDAPFVNSLLPRVKDPVVLNYWNQQIAQTSDFHKSEVLDYIISKLSIFVTDQFMRNILGQAKSSVYFGSLISDKKAILLDFGKLAEYRDANKAITAIVMYKLLREIKYRMRNNPVPLSIYVDDVTNWPTVHLGELLISNRKYGINLILTTNAISEADPKLRNILLRTGSLVSFRLHTADAQILEKEFHHQKITADKLCLLEKYHAFVKTLSEGNVLVKDDPVSFPLYPSIPKNQNRINSFKSNSRKNYGVDARIIEEDIRYRMK